MSINKFRAEDENELVLDRHVLWIDNNIEDGHPEDDLRSTFCGTVVGLDGDIPAPPREGENDNASLFVCGDISDRIGQVPDGFARIFVVADRATGYDDDPSARDTRRPFSLVHSGQVPRAVHGVGVFFPRFFAPGGRFFERVTAAHEFQTLRESNKPSHAFRTGIYLTKVAKVDGESGDGEKGNDDGESGGGEVNGSARRRALAFRLLRCSTNLSGATDNFRPVDSEIVSAVQEAAQPLFASPFALNHVLAQVYRNSVDDTPRQKERKARIKEHSDKTKDMPKQAIIAFVSLYKGMSAQADGDDTDPFSGRGNARDGYDYRYKGKASLLTKLRFRLKPEVPCSDDDDNHCNKGGSGGDRALRRQFDVTLFPDSVLCIPLSTNRLYTHAIVPSDLPVPMLPVRLGYVVRCSETEAVHRDGRTHIFADGAGTRLVALEPPTVEGVREVKDKYRTENMTTEVVPYENIHFSLNEGDYMEPIL